MKVIVEIPEEEYELCKKQYDTECLDVLMITVKYGTPLVEWLSSFNTDSASVCFNKIQELKRECENK